MAEMKYIPQDVSVRQFRGQFLYDVRFVPGRDEVNFHETDLFQRIVGSLGKIWAFAIFNFDALIPTASFLVPERNIESLKIMLNRPCDVLKIYKTRNGLAWYSRGNVIIWNGIQGSELPLFTEWMRLTTEHLNSLHDQQIDFANITSQQKLSFTDFCREFELNERMKHFKPLFTISIISNLWDVPPARVRPDIWAFATDLTCIPMEYREQAKVLITPYCREIVFQIDDLTHEQIVLRDRQREYAQRRIQGCLRFSDPNSIDRRRRRECGDRLPLAVNPSLLELSDSS
jgi:hypothetical protein